MNLYTKSLASLLLILLLMVATLPYFFICENNNKEVSMVKVAVEQKIDTAAQDAIKRYCKKYEDKGIKILSSEVNYNYLISLNKTGEMFNSTFYCIKLQIDGKDYYFKSEQECNEFKDKINNIKQKNIEIAEIDNKNSNIYSTEESLNKQIAAVKEEKRQDDIRAEQERIRKEKEEQERIRKENEQKQIQLAIASRGGERRREEPQYSDFGGGVPLASYVYISSHFGERSSRRSSYHTGTDFAASAGTKIYAWKSGTITMANWNGPYGNMVAIDHGNGVVTRYAHMSGYAVSNGQYVEQGQVIGYVGSTGNSTGPHAHIELMLNGNFVNFENYIR